MRSPVRTIAIIGGGFSGTVLAVNLLRRASAGATRIVMIESRPQIGRGVAYRRDECTHLLNVPAARMSAESRDPLQFARFAHGRDPRWQADDFLPRRMYGDYLQALLINACDAAPAHVRFERIQARADAVFRIDPEGPHLVSLSNQQRFLADDVILACGDPPPASPPSAAAIERHPAYLRDPFRDGAFRADAQAMLLIGTGLTMADVAIAAAGVSRDIRIHAISRHGLLPAEQSAPPHPCMTGPEFAACLPRGALTARTLLRTFRAQADWREAVNAVRQVAPELWQRLPLPERARFLRHLRVRWDVHRHRMPPAIAARLREMRRRGQLQIHAGFLSPLTACGDRIAVQWRERGSRSLRSLEVDQVINCAGSDRRITQTRDPLLAGLIADGLAVPDPLGLGWRTGRHGALIDRDGKPAAHLYYLGPMLRAEHWEATAVGELRGHAERLAEELMRVRAPERASQASASQPAPLIAPARRLDQLALE